MRRHSEQEISAILRRARELEQAGHLQPQICEMLDVSVMTLHRWRKMERMITASVTVKKHAEENRLLRKIVSDILLEIAQLKEISENSRATSP